MLTLLSFEKDKMVVIKAILAILIVADHLTFFIDSPFLTPFRELGAPIVSVFLFISGYGLYKSYKIKGTTYLQGFIRNRIWRVLLPAIIAWAFYEIFCQIPNRNYLEAFTLLLTHGVPLLPFSWFVFVIIIFYFIFYFSFKYSKEPFNRWLLLFGGVAWITLTILLGYDRCWWIGSLAFPTGSFIACYEQTILDFCRRRKYNYCVLLIISCIVFGVLYLTNRPLIWTFCYVFIPIIVYLIVLRLPLERFQSKLVLFIAMISYEIYLCQGIAMDFFRGRIWVQSDLAFIILVYSFTILLAGIVHVLSKRLFR